MVSDVSLTGAAQDAQKTQQQEVKLAEDFNQFLTLLTTQIQNQDPLDPMKSKEFTNQLVQFSQVEQAINTNQKLDNLVSLQLNNSAGMALGYVGLDINYVGSETTFDGETPVEVNYSLDKTAVSAKANIFDEAGNLVYTKDIDNSAGSNSFKWDGAHLGGGIVEPGTYSVSIDAVDSEGNPIEKSVAVSGRVRGVESQDGQTFLLVGERAVPLGQVINASVPAESSADDDSGDETTNGGSA